MALETLGTISAAAGIATVGVQVVHSLGSLIQDVQEAPQSLIVLKSQVDAFSSVLENIRKAESGSNVSITKIDLLSRQLGNAVGGGFVIIKQLQTDILEIRSMKPRRNEGRKSEMSLRERLMYKWNDDHINKWSDVLHRHATVLLLLLESQKRLQDTSIPTNPDDNTPPIIDWEQLHRQISEIDPTYSSTSEWAVLGENAQFDLDLDTKEKESASIATIESDKREVEGVTKKRANTTNELLEEYRRMLSADTKDLAPDCPKFRILLLGKTGVGKSTLSSRVLGIPYKKSTKLHGDSTPADVIWNPIPVDGTNNTLELHDSGGFEPEGFQPDDKLILQHAKDFIESKRTAKLADQIHAIWYLISCSAERPVQKIDRGFFAGQLIETGEIPVFVVFTKYDRMLEDLSRDAETETSDEKIEKQADDYFKSEIEKEVKNSIKDHSKFSFCKVGLRKKGAEYIPLYHGNKEPFGTKALVEQMTARLCVADLRILWIATQQRDDRSKLFESIEHSIRVFWTARKVAKASVLPYVCMVGLEIVFSKALKLSTSFWKIRNWDMSTDQVARAIFEVGKVERWIRQGMLIYNMFGSYSMAIVTELALNFIIGANLIGRLLFRLESQKGGELVKDEIYSEVRNFKHSEDRNRMAQAIAGNIMKLTQIDYKADNKEEKVLEVAWDAVEAAIGYADASFFRDERLRMVKDLSM